MTLSTLLRLAVAAVLYLAVSGAEAEDDHAPLAGAWSVVRVDNILPDGSRVALYGPHPQGLLVFDRAGHYSLQLYRARRAPFASGDKSRGTAAELEAAVEGSNAHFGRYAIDPDGRTIRFEIEHASFPNWDGTVQVRRFTLAGDRLTYTVPTPTIDTRATGEVVWQRLP
jgi:hypothetical protein